MKFLSMLAVLSMVAGCGATTKQLAGDAKTAAIDCTKGEVQQEVAGLLPLVLPLVTGGDVSWDAVSKSLQAAGATDVGCVLAAVEQSVLNLAKTRTALSAPYLRRVEAFRDWFDDYRHARFGDAKFIVTVNGENTSL